MSRGGLRRLGGLLGPAVVVALGCGEVVTADGGSEGDATGSGSGSGASNSGTDGSSGTGTGSTGTSSSTETSPPCGVVPLLDVAHGTGGYVVDGEAEEDWSGWSISAAGDVNGDGLADVIVGAPRADPNGLNRAGRSYVVFGKAETDGVSLVDVAQGIGGFAMDSEAESLGYSGHSVSGAGDVNGDGLADVMVGVWRADPNDLDNAGRTYVVFGKTDTEAVLLADVVLGAGGFAVDGEAMGDSSGSSVNEGGDVNGDGLADVIVGASAASPNGLTLAGRTYVVFGKTDTEVVSLADVTLGIGGFVLDGEAEYDRSGRSVSTAGDVNGDGVVDLILSASRSNPESPEPCRIYVVLGQTDPDNVALANVAQGIGGFVLNGEAAYDGCSVSGAGDVNGDGLDDVIVGAPLASPNGRDASGRTYVVFGKEDTGAVSLHWVAQGTGGFALDGQAESDCSGRSVSEAGDINGDGLADIVVGAGGVDANDVLNSGRAYVVFGKADTDMLGLYWVARGIGGFAIDGTTEGFATGKSVSGAGDINGDQVPDVIVSAWSADPNGLYQSGRTYVVFGGDFSCAGG